METSLRTPMTARVYVNLPEGMFYMSTWMTNGTGAPTWLVESSTLDTTSSQVQITLHWRFCLHSLIASWGKNKYGIVQISLVPVWDILRYNVFIMSLYSLALKSMVASTSTPLGHNLNYLCWIYLALCIWLFMKCFIWKCYV